MTERLAPSGGVLRRTVAQNGTQTENTLYGYAGPGDGPSYTVASDASGGPVSGAVPTSFVVGPEGSHVVYAGTTAATLSFPLVDVRGSVVGAANGSGTITRTGTLAGPGVREADEYGNENTPASRLGWLRGHQRYHTGGVLGWFRMGVRLYDPDLGRFHQVDPIEGGCANDYTYVHGDPVNQYDLNGEGGPQDTRLSRAEAEARVRRSEGLPYDRAAAARGDRKVRAADKYAQERNTRKQRGQPQRRGDGGHRSEGLGPEALGAAAAALGTALWRVGKAASPACGPLAPACAVVL